MAFGPWEFDSPPHRVPYKNIEDKRKNQREWKAKRRADYLKGKSCAICGSTNRLEIDHIDPKMKVSHDIWSWSATRREAELAKCQVLCYDHHLEKTLEQRAKTDHGRGQMYQKYKCRCKACRAWKRESDAKYRGNVAER